MSDRSPEAGELAALRALLADRDTRIGVLERQVQDKDTAIAALAAQVEELTGQVADLAARVKQTSKNSSRPPSGDGLAKPAPKSLRKKTGRKPGRPKGQPGATMELTDYPDDVVRHEPACCAGCGKGLAGAAETGMERRQVTEIPPAEPTVTGHQMTGRQCACGARTKGEAPAGVNAPVRYGPRVPALSAYLWHGQFLSKDRACTALAEIFGCAPSPAVIATAARKSAAFIAPALDAIVKALLAPEVAHSGETGFRVAGKLAWAHPASSGKYAMVTVHARRGTKGMDAAGVLPSFAGIAVHDAWAPYGTCTGVAAHALCNSHVLRELIAVTETGTELDAVWAQQATGALLALKEAAEAAAAAGDAAISQDLPDTHARLFTDAAGTGILINAGRRTKLQKKRHALATRMKNREAGYLRFARDLRVPFDNNEAERVIRMSKLRIKVSGCMRSMTGAETFCAIRSYLATAARHGIGALDALTMAAEGRPWIPDTT